MYLNNPGFNLKVKGKMSNELILKQWKIEKCFWCAMYVAVILLVPLEFINTM